MIVELIEVRKISAASMMQSFLQQIPQPAQLSELYLSFFLQHTGIDLENQKLAATALKNSRRHPMTSQISRTNLFSDEKLAIEELPQEPYLFDGDFESINCHPCCTWEVWKKNMIKPVALIFCHANLKEKHRHTNG